MMVTDGELLTRYVNDGDREALGTLVGRHIAMVRAAALRQTRSAHEADDITQIVFLALIRKADQFAPDAEVAPWLMRAVYLASKHAARTEHRRKVHTAAFAKSGSASLSDDPWSEVAPALDRALQRLRAADRDAITLRYFSNRSYGDVGRHLGTSEEAARKRVDRAVERLRLMLPPTMSSSYLVPLLQQHALDASATSRIPAVMSVLNAPDPSLMKAAVAISSGSLLVPIAAGVIILAAITLLTFAMRGSADSAQNAVVPAEEPVAMVAPPVADIPDPLTLEAVLEKVRASRDAVARLSMHVSSREEQLHEGGDQWRPIPAMSEFTVWIEFQPRLRYRLEADPRVTRWMNGAAPYLASREVITWNGSSGVYRTLAIAHHTGVEMRPWFDVVDDRPIDAFQADSHLRNILLAAPHVDPLGTESLVRVFEQALRTREFTPGSVGLSRVSVAGEELVLVELMDTPFQGNYKYWLDPARGWLMQRYERRRTPADQLEAVTEITAFTQEENVWFPAAAIMTSQVRLGDIYPGVRGMRIHQQVEQLKLNPAPFSDSLFDP